MKILLTNDDGIESSGFAVLKQKLEDSGLASKIWVVAPKLDRSGTGLAYYKDQSITKISEDVYCVDGTPADCVRLAVNDIIDEEIDFIFSGINKGENTGLDVFFSGTVGAAFTAGALGIKSIAFSQMMKNSSSIDWTNAEGNIIDIIKKIIDQSQFSEEHIFNVNFPCEEYKGERFIDKTIKLNINKELDSRSYIISSEDGYNHNYNYESEVEMLNQGYATITALSVNLTPDDPLFDFM